MDKTIYEKPELIELDSLFSINGNSRCDDGFSEEIGNACPNGADDEDP